MKRLLILLLLTGCSTHATKEDKPKQVDLAAMVAAVLADKPVVYIERAKDSKRIIHLCPIASPGAYKDGALQEAIRTINHNKASLNDCANRQLRDIADEYGLEVRE